MAGGINIREELSNAINELAGLLDRKEGLEIAIAKQRRKVAAWQELCAADDDAATIDPALVACSDALLDMLDLGGLTDACRTVLRAARDEWMTLYEIQVRLRELGFSLEKYKAPAASIATTVNRLVDSGDVQIDRQRGGAAVAYKWAGRSFAPMTDQDWLRPATVSYPIETSLAGMDAKGELSLQGPKTKQFQALRDNFIAVTEKRRRRTL
jgi:hypothetical protein